MSTKAIQGKLWSVAPQDWAQHFEPWFSPMYRYVLENLQLSEEHVLLDAGCGSGLFSSLAIDAGAHVIGVDASRGLLDVARSRNPKNNYMEEDLESLPFANESFHVVTGFNSFQYAGNFDRALAEAARVLKPGGRLVIGIWDKPEKSDATIVLEAIGKLLPPPPPGTSGPFALSEDGRIERSLERIGLQLIDKATISCPFLYRTLADGVSSFMGTGPAAAAINNTSKPIVEEIVTEVLEPFHLSDGMHFLQNSFLVFIAEK